MEEVEVIQRFEDKVANKEVVVVTELDEQPMEGVNRVKYENLKAELVPTDENVAITEA